MSTQDNRYESLQQPAESKQALAYQQIKDDIMRNVYPEGTVMVERKLCDIYHVSRSPIRNALQQLTHEGLLSFVPGKGVVVSSFTTEDILEVYDLIELLQVYAINVVISKNSLVAVEALQLVLHNMQDALDKQDIYQCTRWDQKFHELLVEYSNNSRLQSMYELLSNQQMRFLSSALDDIALAEQSYHEHCSILESMKQKDISAAETAIHNHYRSIKQYYINKLLSRIHI